MPMVNYNLWVDLAPGQLLCLSAQNHSPGSVAFGGDTKEMGGGNKNDSFQGHPRYTYSLWTHSSSSNLTTGFLPKHSHDARHVPYR